MKSTRIAVTVFVLLLSAATVARAQNRASRWGGGGSGVSSSTNQETHTHVAYQGPSLVIPGNPLTGSNGNVSRGQSSGGSWNGARPTSGGSPAAPPRQQGTDLSALFGYVPERGETAHSVPIPPAVRGTSRRAATTVMQAPAIAPQEHHPRITWP